MPVHDWTRVTAGIFHAFHNSWIASLQTALNSGLLPSTYYALGDQRSGDISPDLLTLRVEEDETTAAELEALSTATDNSNGMIAVTEAPPRVRLAQEAESEAAFYLAKRRSLVIRHVTGDRVVALVEIVSTANKHNAATIEDFSEKVISALREGVHVLMIDLHPPTRHDPRGMHGVIWEELLADPYEPPPGLPLTMASYCAKTPVKAYVEPISVGSSLIDMPLFLTRTHYILVPLEETYQQAWSGVPERWRRVIEAPAATDSKA